MRLRPAVLAALTMAGLVVAATLMNGCTSGLPAGPPTAVYTDVPRAVRPSEIPTTPIPTADGDATFEIIGLTRDMRSLAGSHAELPPKGRFLRLRIVVSNTGRNTVLLDTARQLLLTADGGTHIPDSQAMLVKRQPGRLDVGPGNRFEFDLYYDIPADAVPTGLRAFGGPTLADFQDLTGTDIPLR